MAESVVAMVLDEGKWLFASMLLSALVVATAFRRRLASAASPRANVLWAMNLFYGCMIGMMAAGHLLAVTVRLIQGTLEGSWLLLYPLGLVLAVPAWWLALRVGRYVTRRDLFTTRILALNAWLALSLLAMGIHNLPLALPAALNIAYLLLRGPVIGRIIFTVAVVLNLALFTGSLVFMASGRTFEELRGID